jgi:hypothetical protein
VWSIIDLGYHARGMTAGGCENPPRLVARCGNFVLGTPGSSWAWAAPAGAAGGGLAVIFLLGLRWVRRGRVASSSEAVVHGDELEDRLDDELRAID